MYEVTINGKTRTVKTNAELKAITTVYRNAVQIIKIDKVQKAEKGKISKPKKEKQNGNM